MRRAIAPTLLQLIQQPTIVERRQSRGSNRWPRDAATQSLEPLSIARRQCYTRMRPQARDVGAQGLRSCGKILGIDGSAPGEFISHHEIAHNPGRADGDADRKRKIRSDKWHIEMLVYLIAEMKKIPGERRGRMEARNLPVNERFRDSVPGE